MGWKVATASWSAPVLWRFGTPDAVWNCSVPLRSVLKPYTSFKGIGMTPICRVLPKREKSRGTGAEKEAVLKKETAEGIPDL